MSDNIVDFNEFRKKKAADSSANKSSFFPSGMDQFYDDDALESPSDEETHESSYLFHRQLDNLFSQFGDILAEAEEYDTHDDFQNQLSEELTELQKNEPSEEDAEQHEQWQNDFDYIESRFILFSLARSLLTRAEQDDEMLAGELADGTLKESDLLINADIQSDDLSDFFYCLPNSGYNDSTGETSLQDIRKLIYTYTKYQQKKFDDLIEHEPPESNCVRHARWETDILSIRVRIQMAKMTKAFFLVLQEYMTNPEYAEQRLQAIRNSSLDLSDILGDQDYWDDEDDDWDDDDDDDEDEDDDWDDEDEDEDWDDEEEEEFDTDQNNDFSDDLPLRHLNLADLFKNRRTDNDSQDSPKGGSDPDDDLPF